MSKKVSELIKELDISIQEIKGYADKLGIAISSARSTIEDQAAERLTRSINMMRGTSSGDRAGGSKPKIKAVPVVHKEGAKPKLPVGKPVIPKKPAAPKAEEPAEEKPAEEKPETVAGPAAEEAKAAEIPAAVKEPEAPKPAEEKQEAADKPAETVKKEAAEEKPAEEGKAAVEEKTAAQKQPEEKPAEIPAAAKEPEAAKPEKTEKPKQEPVKEEKDSVPEFPHDPGEYALLCGSRRARHVSGGQL